MTARLAGALVNGLLVAAAFIALFPLAWMLSVSFMQPGEASAFPPPLLPAHATLANYHTLFARAGMGRHLANSLLIAGATTLLSLLFNLAAGYAFAKLRFAGRETMLTGSYDGGMDSWIDRQKARLEKSRRSLVGEINGERYRTTLLPEHAVEEHFQALRQIAKQLEKNDNSGSNPLAPVTSALAGAAGSGNPLAPITNALGGVTNAAGGSGSNPLSPLTGALSAH